MRAQEEIILELSHLVIELGIIAKDAVSSLGQAAQFGRARQIGVIATVNCWELKAMELDKKLQAIGLKLEVIGAELEGGAR